MNHLVSGWVVVLQNANIDVNEVKFVFWWAYQVQKIHPLRARQCVWINRLCGRCLVRGRWQPWLDIAECDEAPNCVICETHRCFIWYFKALPDCFGNRIRKMAYRSRKCQGHAKTERLIKRGEQLKNWFSLDNGQHKKPDELSRWHAPTCWLSRAFCQWTPMCWQWTAFLSAWPLLFGLNCKTNSSSLQKKTSQQKTIIFVSSWTWIESTSASAPRSPFMESGLGIIQEGRFHEQICSKPFGKRNYVEKVLVAHTNP